ncbi:methyltransferase [Fulvivirgaceae bacterium BMA10]|uniref:tRNA1(Val) (adenine(37)-N6)-methyltransferase n=1 Tax=Splendidivirga corallicola TaxID=3051826 RepID=A0ABT8KIQ8_9BACT|nr:methyltransferase [Fulvivirgaceae bacterium BMA10]
MGNTYFQFKQFRIDQDKCGMKVCQDSCILGAYTVVSSPKKILDIGTGTGLLSLMLAQRYKNSFIDAVEINKDAFFQAEGNFANSPWSDKIGLFKSSIQDFALDKKEQYDLIVSNPPFFQNHLRSNDASKNVAIHNDSLSFGDLAMSVHKLLSVGGSLFVMYPEDQSFMFEKEMVSRNLYPQNRLIIKDKATKPILRIITNYSRINTVDTKTENLIIKQPDGTYTKEFADLLKDYYLIF